MRHVLVVGGTGMLAGVVHGLAEPGVLVSVVARGRRGLARVAADAPAGSTVSGVRVDYRESDHVVASLRDVQAADGPFDLAICWIHGSAPAAPTLVMAQMPPGSTFLHVLGSGAADPARGDERRELAPAAGVVYRQVVLGFVVEGDRSRWLTHAEIAAGVLEAIDDDAPRVVVGTVEPWDARP